MAVKLGDALVYIGADERGLDRALVSGRNKVAGWLNSLGTGILQGVGQAVAQGVGNLVKAGLDEIGKSVKSADKLNESLIRTGKVFGASATDIRAWAQEAAKALGLSEAAALDNASALGSMLVQLGANRDQAASMSKQMIEAAADIAAFRGVTGGAAEVLETFASGFRGEYDSLQKFLPAITDASIKQQALADTGKASEKQLTNLEKALATQTLILQGAAIAAGSFADATARGANSQEIFAARMENARAELGQVGLIIQQEFYGTLNELLDSMGFYGENITAQLVVGLTKGLIAITPFLAQLRGVFVTVLQPHSPPKLLPELNDWGKAAAEEYLKGWSLADGKSLETLGSGIENVLRSFAGAGRLKATDLVSRVFGSQKAIVGAINEWRQLGTLSVGTLNAIQRAAGPAGDSVGNLVNAYFDLQNAAKNASDAQQRLGDVTRRYDDALSPLNDKLDALRDKQQELRDQQRLEELGKIIADPRQEASDRQLARLEAEEIQLRQQVGAIEDERDAAVDAEQQKIDAAEKERQAKQQVYDQQQAILDQQVKANALIEEEVTLRQQLADEVLAKEEKARRELEAQRQKEQSDMERIAVAQLRYQLATTDTAGQLELMRAELAKVAVGSADYFDILTQIANLEERLATERASNGGGGAPAITEAGESAQRSTKYLDDFRIALDAAMGAAFGADGQEVKLTPFWSGVADTITDIKDAALEAIPTIQSLVDFFFQPDASSFANQLYLPSVGGGTGSGNTSIMGKIYSAVTGTIANLRLIHDGDWTTLWSNFKQAIDDNLNASILAGDVRSIAFYSYLTDTLIPAIDALRVGEWKTAWELLGGAAVTGLWDGFRNNEFFVKIGTFITKLENGDLAGAWAVFGDGTSSTPPATQRPQSDSGGGGGGLPSWLEDSGTPAGDILLDIIKRLMGIDDSSSLQPQSYAIPGVESLVPAMAGAGSSTIQAGTTIFHIEQYIGLNGDVGGARQGAQLGIRELLLDRRLNGV